MDDLISRQTALDALWEERQQLDDYMDECLKKGLTALRAGTKAERNRIEEDIEIIKELPSAQPERKKGKWIDLGKDRAIRWQCPECGRKDTHIYNYCPDCGTDMRKVE